MYWFCQISKWICHRYTCVPHSEPSCLLPPHTIPLGHPSAPAPSIQYCASNLDWRLIQYMILYVFQCHSPKSSHPLPHTMEYYSAIKKNTFESVLMRWMKLEPIIQSEVSQKALSFLREIAYFCVLQACWRLPLWVIQEEKLTWGRRGYFYMRTWQILRAPRWTYRVYKNEKKIIYILMMS